MFIASPSGRIVFCFFLGEEFREEASDLYSTPTRGSGFTSSLSLPPRYDGSLDFEN